MDYKKIGSEHAHSASTTNDNDNDKSAASTPPSSTTSCAVPDEHNTTTEQSPTEMVPSANQPEESSRTALAEKFRKFPFTLAHTKDGKPFAITKSKAGHSVAMEIGGSEFESYLVDLMYEQDGEINLFKIRELVQQLAAYATFKGDLTDVWNRCASFGEGCEIALHDEQDQRVRVTADGVSVLQRDSVTVFQKSPHSLPLPTPSSKPEWDLVKQYINLPEEHILALIAWLTYTMVTPKAQGKKYVFLVVQGNQGTGKSLLCRLLQRLIDPSVLELQAFPTNSRDLPVILNGNHLAVFDNVRSFSSTVSDQLCTASTGGTIGSRAMYTNNRIHTQTLHGALVFNGIHGFVVQSDLAQRCLTVHTQQFQDDARKTEAELLENFENDLPDLYAGLLDLSSKAMGFLPQAEVTHPERMLEFCRWISAVELAMALKPGEIQATYSNILNDTQLDTLMESSLASAVLRLISDTPKDIWEGTPQELLSELEEGMPSRSLYARDWPQNPIQLSKRLEGLRASLESQGILIERERSKVRKIIIRNVGGQSYTGTY